MDIHSQRFSVDFEYPVVFTRGLFETGNPMFADTLDRLGEKRRHRALFFLDAGLVEKHPTLEEKIQAYAGAHRDHVELAMPPRIVPGGEAIKNDYRLTMEIVDTILECRLCRQSYVVAVGGGAVLDAVGFAASIVHRGLRLVRVPTTVLSQNDGGVGVKNGMNLHGGKNTIGTFAPPFAVLNDFSFLSTLADRQWGDGIAEAFKVAIIKDREFFESLCRRAADLKARETVASEEMIRRCAVLHLEHICSGGDPFEFGSARPLDFGHWAAHKLESMSNYRVSHGEAVALGIALDVRYAEGMGWLSAGERDVIFRGMTECGLSLWHADLDQRLGDGTLAILGGLDDFREHLGGRLAVTYPDGIGHRKEVDEVDPGRVEEAVAFLRSQAPLFQGTP